LQQSLESKFEEGANGECFRCVSCGLNKGKSKFYYHDREKTRLKQRCKECEKAERRNRNFLKNEVSPTVSAKLMNPAAQTNVDISSPIWCADLDVLAKALEILLGIDQRLRG